MQRKTKIPITFVSASQGIATSDYETHLQIN